MEYCPFDLERIVLSNRNMQPAEIKKYCREAVLCIKACHDMNIAHCDIKPANFMTDEYGRLKIGDFGLATIFKDSHVRNIYSGTKIMMAPEIYEQNGYDAMAADIWALGCTLYFIATGRYPFFVVDPRELVQLISLAKYDGSLIKDKLLRDVIARCLRIEPKDRLGDAIL
ncbi:AGC family protein kinase [Trichomonas vaginalis G3]|uniref:AGC family protein kinase n=1 Tax=Trichomonas vaginalis (strain ATCC PRA-98 / G3) TaxID=412133 RepID=A2FBW1_TRIV3|nr:regulation of centriole replication [Trichomonas vaginalis G3]EAX97607.1 AGC family protein kinase [Trichomonas vaginalis G3]KAI5510579.1 regulation of centriole replication [Trichomonas vaginalis G3]|eukprot:XP_001310537.1 AGC family protein kinase [Trichomonas vaginalis G3]